MEEGESEKSPGETLRFVQVVFAVSGVVYWEYDTSSFRPLIIGGFGNGSHVLSTRKTVVLVRMGEA